MKSKAKQVLIKMIPDLKSQIKENTEFYFTFMPSL